MFWLVSRHRMKSIEELRRKNRFHHFHNLIKENAATRINREDSLEHRKCWQIGWAYCVSVLDTFAIASIFLRRVQKHREKNRMTMYMTTIFRLREVHYGWVLQPKPMEILLNVWFSNVPNLEPISARRIFFSALLTHHARFNDADHFLNVVSHETILVPRPWMKRESRCRSRESSSGEVTVLFVERSRERLAAEQYLSEETKDQSLDKPSTVQWRWLEMESSRWINRSKKRKHHGLISTFSRTFSAFRADHPPMETWSSWPALVDMLSTEDGWQRTLFSETKSRAA